MKPEDARSPQHLVKNLTVLVTVPRRTSPNESWSFALLEGEDNVIRYGLRWNGETDNPKDKGFPSQGKNATWMILPDEVGRVLANHFAPESA